MQSFLQARFGHQISALIALFLSALLAQPVAAQFVQQGPKLVGAGAQANSEQGFAVALSGDGNTAIVGAPNDNYNSNSGGSPGAAWVFTRSGGVWTQQGQKLLGNAANAFAQQGHSVALSADGKTTIVGAPNDGDNVIGTGAAFVFTYSNGAWIQQGDKLGGTGVVADKGATRGFSVALSADGNTALIGGPRDNGYVGAAWVFTRTNGMWTQQGDKLVGTGGVDAAQGNSVALSADGNTAIVGGAGDNNNVGAAWVFIRGNGGWTQQGGKLVGTGAVGNAYQGWSVALSADGNTAVVGGPYDNYTNANNVFGIWAAWVFTRTAGMWTQQGNKLVGTGAVGFAIYQGSSVAVSADGNTAMLGGPTDNTSASPTFGAPIGIGAAWVFTRSGGIWTQQGDKLVGTGGVGYPEQGSAVALSSDGNTAIVGGPGDNSEMGAAWVFIQPTKNDCKNGGWLNFVSPTSPFTFTNQGQCMNYFAKQ